LKESAAKGRFEVVQDEQLLPNDYQGATHPERRGDLGKITLIGNGGLAKIRTINWG